MKKDYAPGAKMRARVCKAKIKYDILCFLLLSMNVFQQNSQDSAFLHPVHPVNPVQENEKGEDAG